MCNVMRSDDVHMDVLQAKLAMDDLAVLVRHLTTLFELVLAYYALLG